MEYQFSSLRMTVWVKTNRVRIIIDSAPIVRKFIGQDLENLKDWMRSQGGFKIHILRLERKNVLEHHNSKKA